MKALPPLVARKLEAFVARARELEALIAAQAASDPRSVLGYSKELGALRRPIGRYEEYLGLCRQVEESSELTRDSGEDQELRALAREELERLEPRHDVLVDELVDFVLVDDRNASRNVILEIRAGTGGDEAALFVADLFRMYCRFAERRRWKVELLDSSPTDLGGFKEVVFAVNGDSVGRDLRYEMGGHRVQRVPETESSGRIHTSAVTVAVMAEAEEIDIELKDSDLHWEFCRASGPGGQKVNKTSSAVRLKHIPTGLVVRIQDESSQHKNRAKALKVLRSRLYEKYESAKVEKEQSIRRSQIGSGDRNQRIRTYNFPQNRVTDHRIGANFNLDRVLIEGDILPVIEVLRGYDRKQQLESL